MKVFEYKCECGFEHLSFDDTFEKCLWCKQDFTTRKVDLNGYYLGECSGKYFIVNIKGKRLIRMPTTYNLLHDAKCKRLDEIIKIDLWPGPIMVAHPNSIAKFV